MAKRYKLGQIIGWDRKPIQTVKEIDGKQESVPATMLDVMDGLTLNLPRSRMTMDNITHAVRLKGQVLDCKGDIFSIEEAEHDWVKKMLVDDEVGPAIFRQNVIAIKEAFDQFERPHDPAKEG